MAAKARFQARCEKKQRPASYLAALHRSMMPSWPHKCLRESRKRWLATQDRVSGLACTRLCSNSFCVPDRAALVMVPVAIFLSFHVVEWSVRSLLSKPTSAWKNTSHRKSCRDAAVLRQSISVQQVIHFCRRLCVGQQQYLKCCTNYLLVIFFAPA